MTYNEFIVLERLADALERAATAGERIATVLEEQTKIGGALDLPTVSRAILKFHVERADRS